MRYISGMQVKIFLFRLIMVCVFGVFVLSSQAQDMIPQKAINDRSFLHPEVLEFPPQYVIEGELDDNGEELTIENLYKTLEEYGVLFKKIVVAQAILETGNFSSHVCLTHHNLFGLRHPSDGSYYEFNNWKESVKAYRDDVQYKYNSGDYYLFLRRIGYAEDPRYVSKVRIIADRLPWKI